MHYYTNGRIGGKLSNTLVFQVARSLGWRLFYPIPPRLALTGFTFAQPFLVTRTLNYLDGNGASNINDGAGLIGACALVYFGISVRFPVYPSLATSRLTIWWQGV
jgi:ATP-binding cassette, subfamily C (CFTR/MRP), member 1